MYGLFVRKFGSGFFDNTRIASTFSLWDLLIQNFVYKPGEKKGNSSILSRWNLGTARRTIFSVPVKLNRKGEIWALSATWCMSVRTAQCPIDELRNPRLGWVKINLQDHIAIRFDFWTSLRRQGVGSGDSGFSSCTEFFQKSNRSFIAGIYLKKTTTH